MILFMKTCNIDSEFMLQVFLLFFENDFVY